MHFLRPHFVQCRPELWRQLILELGRGYSETGLFPSEATAVFNGWVVMLEIGDDSEIRLSTPFINPEQFTLYAARSSSHGQPVISTSSEPTLENDFTLRSNDLIKAGSLLAHDAIRPWLRRLSGFSIEIKCGDTTFEYLHPEGVDVLQLTATFEVRDVDLLEQHYALFGEVMQALCLTSSAYTRE